MKCKSPYVVPDWWAKTSGTFTLLPPPFLPRHSEYLPRLDPQVWLNWLCGLWVGENADLHLLQPHPGLVPAHRSRSDSYSPFPPRRSEYLLRLDPQVLLNWLCGLWVGANADLHLLQPRPGLVPAHRSRSDSYSPFTRRVFSPSCRVRAGGLPPRARNSSSGG